MNSKVLNWFIFSTAIFFLCIAFIVYTYIIEY